MNLGSHILGYPRIGAGRALKQALERYWHGQSSQTELLAVAEAVEQAGWQDQREAGLSVLTVGDFVLYDHVLALSVREPGLPDEDFDGSVGVFLPNDDAASRSTCNDTVRRIGAAVDAELAGGRHQGLLVLD